MEQSVTTLSISEEVVRREWADIDYAVKEKKLNEIMVNIGECSFGKASDVLICLGLGSCVAVVIYDLNLKIAGLAHVMLPSKDMGLSNSESSTMTNKFADVAIPYLVDYMLKAGCKKDSMRAKITGGAQMFRNINSDELFDIGRNNVLSVKEQLLNNDVCLISEDIHGSEGRTMKFVVETSKAYVRTKSKITLL